MFAFMIHDIKEFMNLLLKTPTFNKFTFRQGEIHGNALFTIQGQRNKEDLTDIDSEPYCSWEEIQPFVFQSVKGKKLPKIMKLVLSLPNEETQKYPNTKSVSMNLLFRDGKLICTLSTMQESFQFNNEANEMWQKFILDFLKDNGITTEIQG